MRLSSHAPLGSRLRKSEPHIISSRFRFPSVVALSLLAVGSALAQAPRARADKFPGLASIRETDIRHDMDILASDAMRGREAGTLDELRAAAWIAQQARAAGLAPAGSDGTYFQYFPMRRTVLAPSSRVTIGGTPVTIGSDIALLTPTNAHIDAPIVVVRAGARPDSVPHDVRGKVVVTTLQPPKLAPSPGLPVHGDIYATRAMRQQSVPLIAGGAVAVVFFADAVADTAFDQIAITHVRMQDAIDTGGVATPSRAAPLFLVRRGRLDADNLDGKRLVADLLTYWYDYPSVNVVARVNGTDSVRRNEFVAYSAHIDHDGVRAPIRGDSIWNGADDNASTCVALLAIGRAFVAHPARRSALFIWHGAEERGLLGSHWYVLHPTVPRDSIVAMLNGDLIGRNSPDSMGLLGVQPPHRNSTVLVDMTLQANADVGRFVIDSTWDRPNDPQRFYFRSDHVWYAEWGIPSIFFTSLLERDYHTPADEPSRIDTAKLARVSKWMYATGWLAASADRRPALDPGVVIRSIIR